MQVMVGHDDPFGYGMFAKFAWDSQVTVRNEPVNKDSYILVSCGADGLWGTGDDTANFDQ